jgi:uncharacterized delta-60 repeat protein
MRRNALPLIASAVLAAVALPAAAPAAPGDLDTTFGPPDGLVQPGGSGVATDVLVQPEDGKVVAALDPEEPATLRLVRLRPDGTPDPSFGENPNLPGFAALDVSPNGLDDEAVAAVTRQTDGKYVAAGIAGRFIAVARFNTDGSVDETFADAIDDTPLGSSLVDFGAEGGVATSVAIDAVGRILVGGWEGWDQRAVVARFLPSGKLDEAGFNDSFDDTPAGTVAVNIGGAASWFDAVVPEPGGGVTGAGAAVHGDAGFMFAARFSENGSGDQSFHGSGLRQVSIGDPVRDESADALLRLADGSYVLAGYAEQTSGTLDTALVKLTPEGELDTTFGRDGVARFDVTPFDGASAVAMLPDGRFVVAGTAGSYADFRILLGRLLPDGTPDAGFGSGGFREHDVPPGTSHAAAIDVQPDGRTVIAGSRQVTYQDPSAPLVARFEGGDPAVEPAQEQPAGADAGADAAPPAPAGDTTAPVLGRVTLLRSRFRVARRATALAAAKRGTAFRFTLSEAATVRVTIGGRSLTRRLAAGAQQIAFTGRIGRRRLKPGRKRAVLVATDAAGNTSAARTVKFRITRR